MHKLAYKIWKFSDDGMHTRHMLEFWCRSECGVCDYSVFIRRHHLSEDQKWQIFCRIKGAKTHIEDLNIYQSVNNQ